MVELGEIEFCNRIMANAPGSAAPGDDIRRPGLANGQELGRQAALALGHLYAHRLGDRGPLQVFLVIDTDGRPFLRSQPTKANQFSKVTR